MGNTFIEKIQQVRIYQKEPEKSPLGIAYDFKEYPTSILIEVEMNFFNIKPNKEYVVSVNFIESTNPTTVHLLNNVVLKMSDSDMFNLNNDYGLAGGVFLTTLPIESASELELTFELRAADDLGSILDTYRTYLLMGEMK